MAFAFIFGPVFGQNAGTNPSGISAALHQRMLTNAAAWHRGDAAGLESALSIANGKATLSLMASREQAPEERLRRNLAILAALEFLLDDNAFEQVRILLIEHDAGKLRQKSVKDLEIGRRQFQAATTTAAKTETAKEAIKKSRRDNTVLDQISVELGIR